MSCWIAVSRGALDVRALGTYEPGIEFVVTPVFPSTPLALFGRGAQLWRRLVDEGPLDEGAIDEEERTMLTEMAEAGIATERVDHPSRQGDIAPPWLVSPTHELVYALVATVARDVGVDAVFIKGPLLHHQGLRNREHSGDVDVWVEPGKSVALVEALRPWGWTRQADVWGDHAINHSVTALPRNEWGCQVDIHRRFPGLSRDERASFVALRGLSEDHVFAGIPVRVPSRSANAIIAAIHEVRPEIGTRVPPHATERAERCLRAGGTGVVYAAEALGAAAVLEPLLRSAVPAVPIDQSVVALAPRDWEWRGSPSAAAAYAARIRELPWSLRVVLLARIIWPSRAAVMESDQLAMAHSPNVMLARLRRARRGVGGYLRSMRRGDR